MPSERRDDGLVAITATGESMSVELPAGTPRIQPFLHYLDVSAAIECLTEAFGFRVEDSQQGTDGTLEHAVLDLYDGRVMARRTTEPQRPSGCLIYVYVDDVDSHFAVARGTQAVEVLSEPEDQPWGDRVYEARDVGGHDWAFAQRLAARAD